VGQLDRFPANLAEILRARAVTYGLFSIILATALIWGMPNSLDEHYVVREENEVTEVRQLLLRQIEHESQKGTTTAPEIKDILDGIEEQLNGGNALHLGEYESGMQRQTIESQLLEVERIRNMYGDWTVIHKS
jgi:hypothetical protein